MPAIAAVAAVSLTLLAGCSSECRPGAECAAAPVVQKPTVSDTRPADRGDADTYFAMYLNDPANRESWRWLCRAAASGHSAAQYTVAVRYRDGLPPVRRDLGRAFRWFSAARTQGLTAAALAREDLAKRMPQEDVAALRKQSRTMTAVDCGG